MSENAWTYAKTMQSITVATAFFGVLFGLVQYRQNSENEFRRQQYLDRLEHYKVVAEAVSVLYKVRERYDDESTGEGRGPTKIELDAAAAEEDTFWRMYWGKMFLVESKQVETLMINLGECLPLNSCTREDHKKRHKALLCGLRKDLSGTWKIEFEEIKDDFLSTSCATLK